MQISKHQAAALVGAGASAFLWFKALQRLWQAAEAETEHRRWDLVLSGIVAAGALILAIRRTEKAVTKIEEAFEPGETAEAPPIATA
jgi:hypothetical protein